ncbi:hypothetical protein Tco_1074564 [Tanacetum coccineum]
MKDVFDSIESDLNETWKQNKLLEDKLLEATLKHEIECDVMLSHECVDNIMQDEIKKVQSDSIEIQEGMQKRINILENNNSSKKVEASDRTNKKLDVASKNVALNMFVTNDGIKNALIAKNVLCVSCAKNVLIPCHDNCLAKYKLNVHSNVRRALFTTPRTVKLTFKDTTLVVSKTMFSVRTVQSKSLDTTPVVSKAKIVTDTPLSAKNKVSSVFFYAR